MIDHLEILCISPEEVEASGQHLRGIGFDSDHRYIYADISLMELIGLASDNHAERTNRILKCGNKKKANQYLESLTSKLRAQNVQERVRKLTTSTTDGDLTEEARVEYEKLDKTITQCIIAAEKNSRRSKDMSSKEKVEILMNI